MTVKEAIKSIPKNQAVEMGTDGQPFYLLKWKSPENGQESGPFLVATYKDVAVEVGTDGTFKSIYPTSAEGYFPFLDIKNESVRKGQLKDFIKKLFDRVA